jgi:hypothetical protein
MQVRDRVDGSIHHVDDMAGSGVYYAHCARMRRIPLSTVISELQSHSLIVVLKEDVPCMHLACKISGPVAARAFPFL